MSQLQLPANDNSKNIETFRMKLHRQVNGKQGDYYYIKRLLGGTKFRYGIIDTDLQLSPSLLETIAAKPH